MRNKKYHVQNGNDCEAESLVINLLPKKFYKYHRQAMETGQTVSYHKEPVPTIKNQFRYLLVR